MSQAPIVGQIPSSHQSEAPTDNRLEAATDAIWILTNRRGLRGRHARHCRLDSTPSLAVMLCSMVVAIRAALFLAWFAIVPLKRSSTVV